MTESFPFREINFEMWGINYADLYAMLFFSSELNELDNNNIIDQLVSKHEHQSQ